jgi:hypothetical protein
MFFISDAEYLTTFHSQYLTVSRGESSKEAKYVHDYWTLVIKGLYPHSFKTHVICFLSSHVLCWNDNVQRTALLDALSGVTHSAKLATLWPLLKRLPDPTVPQSLLVILLSCFDGSVSKVLNEKQGEYWSSFTKLALQSVAEPGNCILLVLIMTSNFE